MNGEIVKDFEARKIAVIVRGIPKDKLIPTAEAVYGVGIRFLEVTYSADGAVSDLETAEGISRLCEHFGDKMYIGAGTVLTEAQAELTEKVGGSFIISPDVNEAVISRTKELGLMSMPGALTPTEIQYAHRWGADFVKLFPVGMLGADYLKAVAAPLSHIRLTAVGGISDGDIEKYLNAGAAGFGIGSNIISKVLIAENKFGQIAENAKKYVTAVEKWQATYA